MKRPKRRSLRWWILGLGVIAAGISYGVQVRSQGPGTTAARNSPFNGDRAFSDLRTIVAFGPRPAGSEALAKTRAYIVAELQKAGLKAQLDEWDAVTPRGIKKMVNIRASRPGARATIIALTGHYDTKLYDDRTFVGASDGGSSAAWVLEMARATSAVRLQNSLEFVFFDGEEAVLDWSDSDSVYGSKYDVARRNKAGTLRQLKALILVDMIGDKNLNIHREGQSTPWLVDAIWNAARAMGYTREFTDNSHIVSDDHIPFRDAGIPVVDLIDFDYPHWHEASDTLDKTSAQSLKIVGDVVYASLPEIDRRAN